MMLLLCIDLKRFALKNERTSLSLIKKYFSYPFVHLSALLAKAGGALLCVFSLVTYAEVPDEMKMLIEQQRAKDAYELGMKHPELLGDPLFDYFFGVAAVDSGRVSLGVLALERVLLSNPNDDLARLELGRAYFALGEFQRAREEFNEVLSHRPPAGVVSTLNVYLDAIRRKESQFVVNYGFYGEIGAGYNSNVNAAATVDTITLPSIGAVVLPADSKPKPSPFGFGSIGGNVVVPLDTNLHGFFEVSGTGQKYSQVDGYNMAGAVANTGLKYSEGANQLKFSLSGSVAQLDHVPVPNTAGGALTYTRQLTDTQSVLVGGSMFKLAYSNGYNAYNSNLNFASLGYRKAFPTATWQPVLDVMFNLGQQVNLSDRPDLGRNLAGLNMQLSFLPTEQLAVSVGAGYVQSKYGAQDVIFESNRNDSLYSANATFQYKLTKELSTRAEFTYYSNQSNLNLYGYNQWTGALKLRYAYSTN